ncbi:tripartite tricarboxylate transporter substrate binding protein, partial [Achromobacter sp. 2789STDY5608633]
MNREQHPPIDDAQRRRLLGALGAAGLCALAPWQQALAQKRAWPERPINYVVPFPPGGLTDVAARQVGKALSDAERWNIVVENRPGGSANIGAAHVSHAAPDGYTWLAITLSHAANATLFAGKAGYDLTRDLTPVAGLASSPIMVVVNAKSPIKTMADLARAAAAKPLAAGSSGNGTPPHLTLALYQKLTGAPLMHVPYKGGAPSLTDLIGGHLDVVFSNYPESLSH